METVKKTSHNLMTSAEEGIGTVVGKIEDTFDFHSSKANENNEELENKRQNYADNVSDVAKKGISEADAALTSGGEALFSKVTPVFDDIHSAEDQFEETLEDVDESTAETFNGLKEMVDENMKDFGDIIQESRKTVEQFNDPVGELPGKESKEE